MEKELDILFLGDHASDAELIKNEIKSVQKKYTVKVVNTEKDFVHALNVYKPDLIISDYQLSSFNGCEALNLKHEKSPFTPFIILTGSINEETAAECMKAGADDYVIKENIKRLGPAVISAIEKKKIELDRHHTQTTLRISEDRFSKIMIASNDGYWDWNLISDDVYFSPCYYTMAGYAIDEFPHRLEEFQKRVHPDDIDFVMDQSQKLLNGEIKRFKVEFRFKKKNGEWLWILGKGIIVEWEGKRSPSRFVGTHSDITDQKIAEQKIIHGQRLLLALIQAAQAVQRARTAQEVYHAIGEQVVNLGMEATIFTLSKDRKQFFLSYLTIKSNLIKAGEKLTGLSAKNYRFSITPNGFFHQIITNATTVFSFDDTRPLVEALPRSMRSLAKPMLELLNFQQSIIAPMIISKKVHGLLSISGSNLTESDVPACTAFANHTAIALENAHLNEAFKIELTQRRKTEKALKESEITISTLMSNLPGMAYQCKMDENWTMLFVNEACEKLTGYKPSQIINNKAISYNELIHPDDREHVRQQVENALNAGKHFEIEYRIITASGEEKWVWERGIQNKSTNFSENRLDGVIHDINERKRGEEELQKYREHLEELIKERTAELEEKNEKLEYFNKLFVGREFRIKELRDRVKELEEKISE